MENLSLYVFVVFGAATALTLYFLYKAARRSKIVLLACFAWLGLQAIIALSEFYTTTDTMPPRFTLTILPPLLFIVFCFTTKKGRCFVSELDMKWLTLLNVVRLPVEMVLLWLSLAKLVPELMTFEGRNFDILSGLTAPVIFYFGYVRKSLSRKWLLAWNFICLGLLLNIVVNAILAAPFPFQQFAFDQPNVAVLYFPFVWLPCFIVPSVLLSHLVNIRQLLMQHPSTETAKNHRSAYSIS